MRVSIDQMTNDGYFLTQKDHLDLLEELSKNINFALHHPLIIWQIKLQSGRLLHSKICDNDDLSIALLYQICDFQHVKQIKINNRLPKTRSPT